MNPKPQVLITGGSGMLGFELAKFFSKNSFSTTASYHSNPGRLEDLKKVQKVQVDIGSFDSVKKLRGLMQKSQVIIHCAALTEVNRCELNKKECFRTNVVGTRNILKLAKEFDAKVIFISTPFVFDGEKGNYLENQATQPTNYYAKTKLLGEQDTLKYKNSLVLRVNPIGVRPPSAHKSFIQWFVDNAKNNKSFTLFTDVVTNPVSTKSLADVLMSLSLNFKRGVLHIGSRDPANKADIWDYIVKRFPAYSQTVQHASVNSTEVGKIAPRPTNMTLSTKKAQLLGYKMPAWKTEVAYVLKNIEATEQ